MSAPLRHLSPAPWRIIEAQPPEGGCAVITVIYLDVLLFVNAFVNYFLLSGVCFFTGEPRRRGRFALAAAAGSLFSLTLLWAGPDWALFLIKTLGAGTMCTIAFRATALRRLVRDSVCLLVATYLFGGALFALGQAARSPAIVVRGHSFYIDTSPAFIILCAAGVHLFLCVWELLFRRPRELHRLHEAVVESPMGAVRLKALLDSGNTLRDALTGRSVMVAQPQLAEVLLTSAQRACLAAYRGGEIPDAACGFTLVPYTAVGSEGLLPAFPMTRCTVTEGGRTYWLESPLAAFPLHPLPDGADIIVGVNALQTEE